MVDFKRIWNDYKKIGNIKYCFHPNKEECNHDLINAHSIQKSKILTQIEFNVGGQNSIYSLEDWIIDPNTSKIIGLKPIGKNKASVFNGFCKHHDNLLFNEIENKAFSQTNSQLFFYSYRTFAHSYHQIIEQEKYWTFIRDHLHAQKKNSDVWVANKELHRITIMRQRFLVYKNLINDLALKEQFSGLIYHVRIINRNILLASSLVLVPIYTYSNIALNRHEAFSYVMLNIFPDNGQTVVILSRFDNDSKGQIFMDDIITLDEDKFTQAISSMLVSNGMNTFFSPLLWNQFDENIRARLYDEINWFIHNGRFIKQFFVSRINFFNYPSI